MKFGPRFAMKLERAYLVSTATTAPKDLGCLGG